MRQRVLQDDPIVITGMGALSAAGLSTQQLWSSALNGISPAAWQEFTWGKQTWRKAVCAAPPFDSLIAPVSRAKKLDRAIQLALLAASQALQQAEVTPALIENNRIGMIVGTSRGPRTKWMQALESKTVFPSDAANSTIASVTGTLAQYFSITGRCFVVSATCASGAVAVALAAEQILIGAADIMLVGGTDAPLNPMMIAQLEAAGVLGHHDDPAKTCRPFDRTRNGLCLGEGAGFLVLESMRSAQRRKGKPLAKLTGWATGTENVGRAAVGVEGETLARTMNDALQMAQLPPEKVGYINAHGTGTLMNDEAETNAIEKVFGQGKCPPCSSTKPVTGHCLGATPVLEAILCIEAMRHQIIPPTANCFNPAFPLDVVPLKARHASFENALSNSLGFWGKHGSLLFARCD